MNLERLQEQLEIDEGVVYKVYLDHLGYPTFGIGHLITENDPEHGWEVGTEVSEERVAEAFTADCEWVMRDCAKLYEDWDDQPEEVQQIVANMMFNLGYPRLGKFKGMKAGVDAKDYSRAADEMVDSAWYRQVGNRAERLVERMRALA